MAVAVQYVVKSHFEDGISHITDAILRESNSRQVVRQELYGPTV